MTSNPYKETLMRKRIVSVMILLAIGATAYAAASARSQRQDCPGKIICPLTGEPVCKDRCPLGGEIASEQTTDLPACCRARN